jgi:glycosyltransferase involved in cell wall biosynthesis
MHPKEACALLRHLALKEGQAALTRGFLKALKMIYGGKLYVVDTVEHATPLRPLGFIFKGESFKYLLYAFEVMKALSTHYEVVHVLNVNKPLISIIGSLGLRNVVTYQFSYLPEVHAYWRIKKVLIEKGSRVVIGTSKRISELFNKGLFTYPPVDVELFKPRDKRIARLALNLPSDKVIIGYVGDIDIGRGFDVVARLVATLGSSDVKFFIAYQRIDTLTKNIVDDLKRALRRRALIMRRATPVWYVYNAVDVLLLPIHKTYPTEPPATLIEALASGTPVVGGASLSMRDYESLYIRVDDCDDYAEVVSNIMVNKEFLHELGKRSREFALENLSYQVVSRRLYDALSKLSS